MLEYDLANTTFVGPGGSLPVPSDDEVSRKLAMLLEGECGELGPSQAAAKFGLSRQRYFQLRAAFHEKGALGLMSAKRGPKTNYRRTSELVCQTIRHRFLDPEASSAVIAQKLRQCGFKISKRSVDRIFNEFGLQKKTLQMQTGSESPED
jgi:transposase